MSEHPHGSVTRQCDVAVIGGSGAGLATALQLARQRRSVIVVDTGEPRNAPAAHMHGYLGFDGAPPATLLAVGREEVRSYGGEILAGKAERVTRRDGEGFVVELSGGTEVVSRRVVAATGLIDELPEIRGVSQGWGREVIHCPFCHGYEVRDRRIVHLVTVAAGLHAVPLLRQLTEHLTVVLDDSVVVPDVDLEPLRRAGVEAVRGVVTSIDHDCDDATVAVVVDNGRRLPADAVVVTPTVRARIEPFGALGLTTMTHPMGFGTFVQVDEWGSTAIPGVYAVGNLTDPSHQVSQAAAHGSRVGAMISFDLASEEMETGIRQSANASDWDARYAGDRLWSGNPNGTLVREVGNMPQGRALDIGAGEGGDAIWLAEHGWQVTACDISDAGLTRISREAHRRGLSVTCKQADANDPDAFDGERFDLVTASYASIPRTPDQRYITNLLGAVAPGGRLLVVGHDLEPMRAPIEPNEHSRAYDPDAYVRVDDVAVALGQSDRWETECFEKRTRPAGSATEAHHVDDVVLRARRLPH